MGEIDSLKKIDKDLLKELECPICMEYMKTPIIMCENGHSICTICKQKLKQCPSCRKSFTNVRNLALESVSNTVLTSNKETESSLNDHKCPFARISHEDCTWAGCLKNMKKHIKSSHNNRNDAHVSDGNFNVVLTGFSPTRHYRKAQLIHQEVFYAFWEVKDGKFYCAVLNIGSESNASNFQYKFSLKSKNGLKNISMTFPTRSVIEDLNKILKPGECVLLHYETVIEFLDQNKILSCDFEISPKETLQEFSFDPDPSRCRGGRFARRGRGRWNWNSRGRRGFPESHSSGPLGLFSEGTGKLTKGTKLGWSLSDLRDESHYLDEPSSPVTKKNSTSKAKSGTNESDTRSQLDNMSNNELRDLIIKTMEEKFASQQSSSSSQAEPSTVEKPSVSSQNNHSKVSTFSPIYGLPKKDISKLIRKSFNDKFSVESKKTSNSSQKTPPSTASSSPFEYSSFVGQNPSNENASALKVEQAPLSEKKISSDKNNPKYSGGSSVGNTSSNIYPSNLLEQLNKSSEHTTQYPLNMQIGSSKPLTTDLPKPSIGNSQQSHVPKTADTKPSASKVDKVDFGDVWFCALCNQVASKKKAGNPLNVHFKPAGTTWFCKLCENWRL